MLIAFIALAHTVGILCAFDSIMNTRTPQGSIAWAASLILFPYLAVPAYFILGRSQFQGYVIARRASEVETNPYIQQAINNCSPYMISPDRENEASRVAERLAEMPQLRGNRIDLLVDGDATFKSVFEGIENAQYVLSQFYIVHDDNIGRQYKKLLIKKAKQGVAFVFSTTKSGAMRCLVRIAIELRAAEAFS
ncbi:MAG: PLDc N-terminal domain-containing protein [Polyangiales bacterium]